MASLKRVVKYNYFIAFFVNDLKGWNVMEKNARDIEFNVNAYTARLIGRENVSKLEGAVLEIVKNAYDADARAFGLYYCKRYDCIYIMDNGTGMKEDIIRKHWMTIGNSSKKEDYLTKKRRVQTGAKGIGRFALDRLADICHMYTVSEDGGLEWIVDWRDFDGSKNISEVKAHLFDSNETLLEYMKLNNWPNQSMAEEVEKKDFTKTGTVFRLDGLHDEWTPETMDHLRNHLENLLPPDVALDFRIFFFADDTDPVNAEIISANVESFDYKISFQVEKQNLKIQILRNEFDFKSEAKTVFAEAGFDEAEQRYFDGKIKELSLPFEQIGERNNVIGNFSGVLYFNKISSTKKDTERFFYKDITGRKNLTKDFGGIKIYRDHFRVRPYGEYGDNDFDWLELSARRNRSPAGLGNPKGMWRVGSEQMLGIVDISRDNTNLDDAANRNGIQEGPGFSQLRRILLMVILEFERDRQFVGRKLAEYAKEKDALEAELEYMHRLAEERRKWEAEQKQKKEDPKGGEPDTNADFVVEPEAPALDPKRVETLLDSMEERQEQEIQELRDEMKMLQTLATTGILANMFMHEIRTLTHNIGQELDAAYEAIAYGKDMDAAFVNIKEAIVFKKNFASWFGVTIDSIKKDKRQRKKHNLRIMLETFLNTWYQILKREEVDFYWTCESDIELRCFEFDIENIISNLISNSLYSFDREAETVLKKKEINLDIKKMEDGFCISYTDTGWGLLPRYKERPELILEAFESNRGKQPGEDDVEGTGMGMWIVYKTVLEYNGYIDLSANKEMDSGFKINITIGGQNV